MNTDPLLSSITTSPDICHGKPCNRGDKDVAEAAWHIFGEDLKF